jgi:hypothetical protein
VRGWRVVAATAVLSAAVLVALVVADGPCESAYRAGLRATAGVSVLLFCLAFAASPLNALWPSPATKALVRNRRYLGLSVATSQLAHALMIAALAATNADAFMRISLTTKVGGAIGYAFLVAMTTTSFPQPTAWLGRGKWRALHTSGMWFLWGVFATSYLGRAARPPYTLFVLLLAGSAGLRLAAAVRRARLPRRSRRSLLG